MTLGGNAPAGSQIGLDGSADLAWAIATAWPLVQCVCVCVFVGCSSYHTTSIKGMNQRRFQGF